MPLLAIGKSLGATVAGILGLPLDFAAAMGYAEVLAILICHIFCGLQHCISI